MKSKNRTIKQIAALSVAVLLVGSSNSVSFASPAIYNRPPAPSVPSAPTSNANQKKPVDSKKVLTMDEAIKSAVSNNLNLKKNELTRESLLKEIDENYRRDTSIFTAREWEEKRLEQLKNLDMNAYNKAKQQMEDDFNKAMAASDVVMARLVSQRGAIDMSRVMEREGVNISVRRLFTSVMQKEKDLEILHRKINQDKKNMSLYEKQLALGKISASKLEESRIEITKNENLLKIEEGRLQSYYNELEKLTQINNIQTQYTLEKPSIEYRPIEFSEATQKAQQERAADYSAQVAATVADTKIKESLYENYPYVSTESSYNQLQDEKYIAQLEESQAKRNAKFNAQQKYNSLQEIQQNIILAEKNILKLENQLKDLQSKYRLGLISKNAIDNSGFALDEARNALESLKIQHYQLRITYENAYFAGQ